MTVLAKGVPCAVPSVPGGVQISHLHADSVLARRTGSTGAGFDLTDHSGTTGLRRTRPAYAGPPPAVDGRSFLLAGSGLWRWPRRHAPGLTAKLGHMRRATY